MTEEQKDAAYRDTTERIHLLTEAPCDWIAAMATIACELHAAFDYYHWTGFYRTIRPGHLHVGPYQGGHGCLHIPFEKGVCGAAARGKATRLVFDVRDFPGHIDCSPTTRSEIVVPIFGPSGGVVAVLDIDSDRLAAFDTTDQIHLEGLCKSLSARFGEEAEHRARV